MNEVSSKLNTNSTPVGAALVCGGGIAGVQSALDLANSGFKVYIVEPSPSVGGRMTGLDKTFPTGDCATCILSPKLVECARNTNIEILTLSQVEEVAGSAGNFAITVRKKARMVDASKCTGCGICSEKCIVKNIPNEYEAGLGTRSAICTPSKQSIPNVPSIDREHCKYFQTGKCGVCQKVCPSGAIDYTQQDEIVTLNVGTVILSPGSGITNAYVRGEFGFGRYPNVLTNIQFERMLSASGPFAGHVQRISDGKTPKKLAFIQCVGSRDHANGKHYCSSFCCMAAIKEAIIAKEHYPNLDITIFYMDIRAFGKDFDRYYERAKNDLGIEFVKAMPSRLIDMPKTHDLRLSYVTEDGRHETDFDLVVLSAGFTPSESMKNLAGKLGVELDRFGFCKTSSESPVMTNQPGIFVAGVFAGPKDIPETVAQASGAAAMAMQVITESRGKLVTTKSYPKESDFTDAPPRVGLFICHCGTNIASVVDVKSVVEAARQIPGVAYAETSVYACADNTLEHIKSVIKENDLNRLVIASCTPRTHEGIFRDTAQECGLNPYLVEMTNIRDQCSWVHASDPKAATEKALDLIKMSVSRACRLSPLAKESLPVVQEALIIGGGATGLTAARSLAKQGFKCHIVEKSHQLGGRLHQLRITLMGEDINSISKKLIKDVESDPNITVYLNAKVSKLDGHIGSFTTELTTGQKISHGVVIVATGGSGHTPNEYLLGQDNRVIAQYDLEKKLADGQFDLSQGSNVVMIQCVGSRNDERPFCSRVCCSETVKNALAIKKQRPDVNVIVLYRDIRTYGRREAAYQEAREAGVMFFRYDAENPPKLSTKGSLAVEFKDPSTGNQISIPTDMLALSTGIAPGSDNEEISGLARIPVNVDGFFLEAHMKLRPVDFASEGIFLCGLAHSPKPLEENMSQALAAAGRASTVLSRKSLPVGGEISVVDIRKCASCLTCIRACPYSAPKVVNRNGKRRVEIDAAKCMGCGTCASECPGKAIQLQHYLDDQISAEIDALMEELALL